VSFGGTSRAAVCVLASQPLAVAATASSTARHREVAWREMQRLIVIGNVLSNPFAAERRTRDDGHTP
jgi:hypothetical protein